MGIQGWGGPKFLSGDFLRLFGVSGFRDLRRRGRSQAYVGHFFFVHSIPGKEARQLLSWAHNGCFGGAKQPMLKKFILSVRRTCPSQTSEVSCALAGMKSFMCFFCLCSLGIILPTLARILLVLLELVGFFLGGEEGEAMGKCSGETISKERLRVSLEKAHVLFSQTVSEYCSACVSRVGLSSKQGTEPYSDKLLNHTRNPSEPYSDKEIPLRRTSEAVALLVGLPSENPPKIALSLRRKFAVP